jgi:nitroreductase
MDAMNVILTRRSIREYTEKEIPDDVIKNILKAGFSAPSAANQQPWHFIIIDDKNILNKIPGFHKRAEFITKAKKAILVCADKKLEKFKGYWPVDCSSATENMLLAARALGLGGCWIGIYPQEYRVKELKNIFNLPESVIPFSIVSLGFTDEEQKEVNRYKEDRIHYNKW